MARRLGVRCASTGADCPLNFEANKTMNFRRWLVGLSLIAAAGVAVHHLRAANDAAAESKTAATAIDAGKQAIDRGVTRGGKAPAESDTLIFAYQDDPRPSTP